MADAAWPWLRRRDSRRASKRPSRLDFCVAPDNNDGIHFAALVRRLGTLDVPARAHLPFGDVAASGADALLLHRRATGACVRDRHTFTACLRKVRPKELLR